MRCGGAVPDPLFRLAPKHRLGDFPRRQGIAVLLRKSLVHAVHGGGHGRCPNDSRQGAKQQAAGHGRRRHRRPPFRFFIHAKGNASATPGVARQDSQIWLVPDLYYGKTCAIPPSPSANGPRPAYSSHDPPDSCRYGHRRPGRWAKLHRRYGWTSPPAVAVSHHRP